MAREHSHHTLSVLVENQPGVLTRVASLFARRSFNIESLAVGPTERSDRSCITIRVDASEVSIEVIVACASGERTTVAYSMPGTLMSSM